MPKASNLLLKITGSQEIAAATLDRFRDKADEDGKDTWYMGVSFDPGDGSEQTLLAGLDHERTDEDTIAASMKLYLALWTLRFSTEKLMQSLAREAFLDADTLKELIPDEIEVMDLAGTAPWEVPEV